MKQMGWTGPRARQEPKSWGFRVKVLAWNENMAIKLRIHSVIPLTALP